MNTTQRLNVQLETRTTIIAIDAERWGLVSALRASTLTSNPHVVFGLAA